MPALPNQVTSIRLAPSRASVTTATDTKISRAITAQQNQAGAAPPTTMIPPTPTKKSRRSAIGSSTLPRLDTWWKWRAT